MIFYPSVHRRNPGDEERRRIGPNEAAGTDRRIPARFSSISGSLTTFRAKWGRPLLTPTRLERVVTGPSYACASSLAGGGVGEFW
jgi:hypothetical protein